MEIRWSERGSSLLGPPKHSTSTPGADEKPAPGECGQHSRFLPLSARLLEASSVARLRPAALPSPPESSRPRPSLAPHSQDGWPRTLGFGDPEKGPNLLKGAGHSRQG